MTTDTSLRTAAQPTGTREPSRLLKRPAFILSTVRSGSTLLRCVLNSHTQLCAPSELHLRHVQVRLDGQYAEMAVHAQSLDVRELEYMLWDSLLAHILARSGKAHIVEKSPSNSKIWRRLTECWPDAKFIVLRRHPAAIVASITARGHSQARAVTVVSEAIEHLDHAANGLADCHHVSYEDLTTTPQRCLEGVCRYLSVSFEPQMLHYGRHQHGPFRYGIGDWSERIQSGQIQPPRATPEPTDPQLRDLCRRWGYPSGNASNEKLKGQHVEVAT